MQGKGGKVSKKLAGIPKYVSPGQLKLAGFETPFERELDPSNRWVKLAHAIPWDKIVPHYDRLFSSSEGRPPISGRVIIGALIIKHIESLTDRGTIDHIGENVYMQYFLGYSSFTSDAAFTAPLFVTIRKRMTLELTNRIADIIALHYQPPPAPEPPSGPSELPPPAAADTPDPPDTTTGTPAPTLPGQPVKDNPAMANKGRLLMDATIAPQNITFPTDLKLLDAARRKSEILIDALYSPTLHGKVKPRTYRQVARKLFLNTAKKKAKTAKAIYKANGQQLRFLRRNLLHIDTLLAAYTRFPLTHRQQQYLLVLHTVYEQQEELHRTRSRTIADRIVNIHQPHVRPMVRGKDKNKVEFGSKLQVSLVDGFTFLDQLSWDAFNEGTSLQYSVEAFQKRFGHYPKEVLADQIYCSRKNRKWMKEKGIKLLAKPLGRPSAKAVAVHLRPGERNPIEGKFGQAKIAYGLGCINAKLKETSESWIACIALVLNLVNLMGRHFIALLKHFLYRINPYSLSYGYLLNQRVI